MNPGDRSSSRTPAARDEATSRCIRRIRAVYPDLPVRGARRLDAGQYNDVLVLNDDLIFRFPRYPEGVRTLAREAAILAGIRPYVSLEIPAPIYASPETGAIGSTFVGYRLIPGEPLSRETFAAIADEATLDRLAHQLAAFLRELHGVPVAEAIASPLSAPDHAWQWRTLYQRIERQLYRHMRPDARRQVTEHFESFLDDEAALAFRPALVHGDFGAGNILWDPARGIPTGVIDFAFARLDDPALDYAALASYGEPFLRRISTVAPEVEAMLPRIRFYRGTFALQEALHGVEHADRAAFEAGIAPYR